jgi:MFS family permease
MPALGMLNSLGGGVGLLSTLAQTLGGWSADRLGRKPFLLAGSFAIIAAYGVLALAGMTLSWPLLLAGALVYALSTVSRPAVSSITAESVRQDRHGTAFSLMMVAQTAPGIFMPALGGWITSNVGYLPIFPAGMLMEIAVLLVIAAGLKETIRARAQISWQGAAHALARSVLPPPGLITFSLAAAADMSFWGMGYGLLYGMLTDAHHYSPTDLGLMSAVMSLAWAFFQMPIGRYIDHHDTRSLMVFSELLGIPLMLIWMTNSRLEVLLAAQVVMGLTAATWIPAASTYLARLTRPSDRAEAYGRLNAFRGLIAFPASAIGGLLYAWGGMAAPLTANFVGILITVALLSRCPSDRVIIA